ncbi:MAG: GNAT family N-acetyltransferase [Planctomycetes bacterium]|nr:GNAT family N-acetyltransferase [Planctomycetota bacterium]
MRNLRPDDLAEVVRIDGEHTGARKPAYWRQVFAGFVGRRGGNRTFGICVDAADGLAGYLFGEVRAFEFGSEPAGWVFAVGVDPTRQRRGVASALVAECRSRFARLGVRHVRTMVRRNDVPILSFFRASGFVGGPFVQLEIDLEAPE